MTDRSSLWRHRARQGDAPSKLSTASLDEWDKAEEATAHAQHPCAAHHDAAVNAGARQSRGLWAWARFTCRRARRKVPMLLGIVVVLALFLSSWVWPGMPTRWWQRHHRPRDRELVSIRSAAVNETIQLAADAARRAHPATARDAQLLGAGLRGGAVNASAVGGSGKVGAGEVWRGYERPSDGKVWIGFPGLKARQDVISGDTLALDFEVLGYSKYIPAKGGVSVMVRCNGSDFYFLNELSRKVFEGDQGSTALIDLPRGTHHLSLLLMFGGKPAGVESETYILHARPRREALGLPSLAPLPAGLHREAGGVALWDEPSGGTCATSLLCRVLSAFKAGMAHAQVDGWWVAYYTLAGARLFGWFLPWRADHRWDRGAASPHRNFHSSKTPWKDTVHVAIPRPLFTQEAVDSMRAELDKNGEQIWTLSRKGSAGVGESIVFHHARLGATVELMLLERSGGGLWGPSSLEQAWSRVWLGEDVRIVDADVFGATFPVPADVDQVLRFFFGPGFELVYGPSRLHAPLRHPPPPAARQRLFSGSAKQDEVAAWLQHSVVGECTRLVPDKFAGFERPRHAKELPPPATMEKVFSTFLCPSVPKMPMVPGETGNPVLRADPTGTILVVRTMGCPEERTIIQGDAALQEEAVARFGPDEVAVDMEGPELLSLKADYLGACVYAFPFNLTVDGMVSVRARVFRTGFAALDEDDFKSPLVDVDDLLGRDTWLSVAGTGVSSGKALEHLIMGVGKPACLRGRGGEAHGRWVSQIADRPDMFLSRPLVPCPISTNGARNPAYRAGGSGRSFLVDPDMYAWVARDCTDEWKDPPMAASCLKTKRVLFSGDSHMRVHYNSLLAFACDIPDAAQKSFHTSQCHAPGFWSPCWGATVCLEHNMLGWVDSVLDLSKWDVVVANFGQHCAAGAEHWTLGEYSRYVEAYWGAVAARLRSQDQDPAVSPDRRTRFVWEATHAMVVARDDLIGGSLDWRTNPRLTLFEQHARRVVEKMQAEFGTDRVMYLDAFNLTRPMVEAARGDCGHFKADNIQMALSQLLLNLLCPST